SLRRGDLLGALRLGRGGLTSEVLDVLFAAVDVFTVVLEAERTGEKETLPALEALYTELERIGTAEPADAGGVLDYELDAGMLAVLTEYEEHRLHANIQQNMRLYRLRVQFDLASIDKSLDEIKDRARQHGEIITYLPTGSAATADRIELDILLASKSDLATLIGALGSDNVVVEEIPRRQRSPEPPTPAEATTGAAAPPQEESGSPLAVAGERAI